MKPDREPMSAVDTAWLRMESDSNLMMIEAVLLLDEPPEMDRLRAVLERRLLAFSRFRQRVVMEKEHAFWEDDPGFDLDNHIHRVGLPGKADMAELQAFCADLVSTPLNFRHPLWQIHVIDRVDDDRSALVCRIHHCIADGLALVRVLLSVADESPEGDLEPPASERRYHHVSWLQRGRQLGHQLIDEAAELVRHPDQIVELARAGWSAGAELARVSLQPGDPPTRLKRPLTGRKVVGWAEPLDLDEVKRVAHALDGTVNDVLLTCATGALRAWLLEEGDDVTRDINVAVPFNLRPLDKPIETLGNQFGLVLARLPIHLSGPRERLQEVQQQMRDLKASPQPWVFYGMLAGLGQGPDALEQAALEFLSSKASLVMTNVPGPQQSLYLAGARILQPMVWVPQSGGVGMGLSILSYAGTVQFGVVADHNLMTDPQALVSQFRHSFEELAALVHAEES
ncbi:wax ester/triacylglycerol synthase family O-acyltransferase [Alcanivorax sp. S6407]|uniref:WS/DGAT/MGAT family O-acyltransferase n=1 Tax=Alcanivorax sp. S6407 TaxID=2926424 RepID=UPI001FF27A2F|nr:wax ester/triacylglycerol synthase family O-acyltransferase [Alcanivorax sp. S6407]MCK0153802.1 wax ester/triacylglycerol synthase family O-acyltransferase [Alcanivorax sp. S6407]